MKLTIYHDGQFWVAVVEVISGSELKAVRFVFGSEPHDSEVLYFVNNELIDLVQNTSESVHVKHYEERRINPKRLARKVSKEMSNTSISTYAQNAIKAEHESRKKAKSMASKELKESLRLKKREIANRKTKSKHRGK